MSILRFGSLECSMHILYAVLVLKPDPLALVLCEPQVEELDGVTIGGLWSIHASLIINWKYAIRN